jgi:hypothetical protein
LLQYIGFRRPKDGKYFGNNIPDEPAFTDIAADSTPNNQLREYFSHQNPQRWIIEVFRWEKMRQYSLD